MTSTQTACRENLAGYKIPRSVVVDDFPRTASGKPLKRALVEMHAPEGRVLP